VQKSVGQKEAETYSIKSESSAPIQDHNAAVVRSINHVLSVHSPNSGGLKLNDIQKSTVSLTTATGDTMLSKGVSKPIESQDGTKVQVTVNDQGKITSSTITHPTKWLGLSKPETTIIHNSDGTHTATTTNNGLLGRLFSDPITKTINTAQDGSLEVKSADKNTTTSVKYDTQGQEQSSTKYNETGKALFTKSVPDENGTVTVVHANDPTQYNYHADGSIETNKINENKEAEHSLYDKDGVLQHKTVTVPKNAKYSGVDIEKLQDGNYGVKNSSTGQPVQVLNGDHPLVASLPQDKLTQPQ